MKRCSQCAALLHKHGMSCPQCGAKGGKQHWGGKKRNAQPEENTVIRISAADVVVREYAQVLTESRSPEQLLEEERAYLEDREPVIAQEPVKAQHVLALQKLLALNGPCISGATAPRLYGLVTAAAVAALFAAAVFARGYLCGNPEHLLHYAVRSILAENYEGAVSTLDDLVLRDADNPEVYYQLVLAHQALGEDVKAFAAAQAGYENTGDDRLRKIVTAYTFGANPRVTGSADTQQLQDTDGGELSPAGLAEDTLTALAAVYEDGRAFENGLACVRQNGLWGMIDPTGEFVVPAIYEEILGFSGSLCAVKRDGLWGYIDESSAEHLPPLFDEVTAFVQYRAAVRVEEAWYVIATDGAVQRVGFDELLGFFGPYTAARQGKQWGYVNRSGAWFIQPAYDEVRPFRDGLAAVKLRGRWGYINTEGRTVIPAQYTEAYDFFQGIARVKDADGYYYINPMGWQIGDGRWQQAQDFDGKLAAVSSGELFGFIDRAGDVVIPVQYEQVGAVSQGLAAFLQNGLWGYINSTGQVVIPPQFLSAGAFNEGVARVTHYSGAIAYINLAGQYISDARYEDGGICSQSRIAVKEDGAWGYLAVITQEPAGEGE